MTPDFATLLTTACAFLFAGNVYFVKRLVDKVESTASRLSGIENSQTKLSQDINTIGGMIRETRSDVKDLRRIEIDVAVLKSQLRPGETEG